jgi:hypothetical protein
MANYRFQVQCSSFLVWIMKHRHYGVPARTEKLNHGLVSIDSDISFVLKMVLNTRCRLASFLGSVKKKRKEPRSL